MLRTIGGGGLQSYVLVLIEVQNIPFWELAGNPVVSQRSVLLFLVNVVTQLSLIFESPFAGAKLGLLATQIKGRRGGDCDEFGILYLVGRCQGFWRLLFCTQGINSQ